MKNLYDLLGVSPGDDAKDLGKTYGEAAKRDQSDRHRGEPNTAELLRQIAEACNALRDAERRAVYGGGLQFLRKPDQAKPRRPISGLKHIFHGSVAAVVLAIVLAGGYTLFVSIPESAVDQDEPEGSVAGPVAAGTVAVLSPRDSAERHDLDRGAAPLMPILPPALALAPNDPGALEVTKGEPVPGQARETIDVAGRDGHSEETINQPSAMAAADDSGKSQSGESREGKSQEAQQPGRHEARSADVAFSVPAEHDVASNPSSPGGAVFDDKRSSKSPEPAGRDAGDVKVPKTKESARKLTVVKQRIAGHLPLKQALLEDRHASSGGLPPVFGVGP
jgi:curved DNA-binding protein CbpA